MAKEGGKAEAVTDFIFLGSKITVDGDCSLCLLLEKKATANLDSVFNSRDILFSGKIPYSQSYDFYSSHIQMGKLNHKEGWVLKNWCFWIVVLEKTLESPLDCKEIKLVSLKENQPSTFIGRTVAEAPILWPPDANSRHIGKYSHVGKDWRQKENGAAEGEMVR